MTVAALGWDDFSPAARQVLEWAAAVQPEPVGSDGLLLGLVRADIPNPPLEGFGVSQSQLIDALQRAKNDTRLDPYARSRATLETLPRLSANASEALARARELAPAGRSVEPEDIFRGLLAVPASTAYRALGELIPTSAPPSAVADDGGPDELQSDRPRLTPSAQQTLAHAAAALQGRSRLDPEIVRAAIVLGALQRAAGGASTSAIALDLADRLLGTRSEALARLERIARTRRLAPVPLDGQPALPDASLRADAFARVLADADGIGRQTGAAEIHLRHLLAAAVIRAPAWLFEQLDSSREELAGTLRQAIARYAPDDPAAEWDRVVPPLPPAFDLAGGVSPDAVDPTMGIPLEQDHLDLHTYVGMLATVMADVDTPEPLSIGLFGEWGSGKSYFMGLLRTKIETLAGSDPRYCSNIRQIGFNAWHYADANIWASLGDEIFEQLAGPRTSAAGERAAVEAELEHGQEQRAQLEAAIARADDETKRLSVALGEARARRETSARALGQAAASTLQARLGTAWRQLGVDDDVQKAGLLGSELQGATADVDQLRQAVRGRRGVLLAALGVCAVLLVAGAIAFPPLARYLAGGSFATVAVLISAATAFVARTRDGLRTLHDVTRQLDEESRKALEPQLAALRRAEAEQRVLQAQHDEVVQRVGQLGRELAELSPGKRLYQFVAARAESEDYRSQLGVISTVRKDFEELAKRLLEQREERLLKQREERLREKRAAKDAEPAEPGGIDRIVLYIDDLDRCSPRQVVDVLQAVHLLLALKLFVVVVGVDPRWLLRSLQSEYDRLLTSDPAKADTSWQASPTDYLEKIFQIPFVLPKMTPTIFESLLRSITGVATGNGAGAGSGNAPPQISARSPEQSRLLASRRAANGPGLETKLLEAEEHSDAATGGVDRQALERRSLTEAELKLLASLVALVETPREAKRLLNLYRLVRSTRDLRDAASFLGGPDRPGEYEAVVVLLGLLSGDPELLEDALAAAPAGAALGGLVHRAATSPWRAFADDLEPHCTDGRWHNGVLGELAEADVARWRRLHGALCAPSELVTLDDLRAFQFWAPYVARFSFRLLPFDMEVAGGEPGTSGAVAVDLHDGSGYALPS